MYKKYGQKRNRSNLLVHLNVPKRHIGLKSKVKLTTIQMRGKKDGLLLNSRHSFVAAKYDERLCFNVQNKNS